MCGWQRGKPAWFRLLRTKQQSLDVALVEEDSPIPLDHPASPVGVGEFPVDAPRGNSTLSPGPEMYDMSMGSTPVKVRLKGYWSWRGWIECTTPSVDYAFYDAYRADSWAGAGASAHRGLRSAVT